MIIIFADDPTTAVGSPCRAYTPKLAALYNRAKAQHKAFEVVFVSLDGDEDSMGRCAPKVTPSVAAGCWCCSCCWRIENRQEKEKALLIRHAA